MKKIFFGILALVAFVATSCQQDVDLGVNGGDVATVSIEVGTPTRAYSDGNSATVLKYAVYTGGVELENLGTEKNGNATITNGKASVQLQLALNKTYTIVFWAEAEGAPYTFDGNSVTVDYTGAVCNDESRDAFYGVLEHTVTGAATLGVELYRPFAQVNVGTTDLQAAKDAGLVPTKSKIVIKNVCDQLDLLTGETTATGTVNATFASADIPAVDQPFPVSGCTYLAMSYVLVGKDQSTHDVTYVINEGAEEITRTVGSVPMKANHRTNLYGALLTAVEDVNVEIKPGYGGALEADELQKAAINGGEVTLTEDVVLTTPLNITSEMTINLNGHKISTALVEGSTTNHLYAIENHGILKIEGDGEIVARGIFNYGTITLESGKINACDGNGGYAIRNYEGAKFVMNGGEIVTSLEDDHKVNAGGYDATTLRVDEGATAIINGGVINNICDYTFAIENYGKLAINGGNFTSVHTTVWNKGELVINNGSFTCNGIEGITAHCVVADAGTTTINGGTFNGKDNYNGFNVDASAGAVVYIHGGVFEPVHSGSLYGKGTIVVDGGQFFDKIADNRLAEGYKTIENNGLYHVVANEVDAVATTQSELASAVAAGGDVVLTAGAYTMPAGNSFNANTVLTCEEGVVFEGNSKLDINGATIVGATFSNPGGTAVDQTINGTFKGCTFEGKNGARWCYAGDTVVFEDCVFSGSTYGVHFDGGANDVLFKNCVLSGFNALGGEITSLTFEGCTFVGNGKSGYNGANLWGSTKLINCEFTFDGSTATEWIHGRGDNKTYEFENCTVNGVALTPENYDSFDKIGVYGNASITKVNGVKIKSLTDLVTEVASSAQDGGTITVSSVRDLMMLEELAAQWNALFSNGQGTDFGSFLESNGGKGANYYYNWSWTVKLDADIDFKGATLNKPINLAKWGLLDGQGHTIKNVNVVTAADAENHAALFMGGSSTSMKSVKLDNVHVTGSFVGNSNAAIFAYYCCEDVEDITITNSSVKGGKYTGAVVSSGYCRIKNCEVTNCVVKGGYKLGGIIGYICAETGKAAIVDNNTLTGCTVDGADGQYAGGKSEYIVGKVVGNYNCNGTCKGNTITNMTTSTTKNIGKIEAGFSVEE